MMTDRALRELCMRYFDAIERRDLDAVVELLAPAGQIEEFLGPRGGGAQSAASGGAS